MTPLDPAGATPALDVDLALDRPGFSFVARFAAPQGVTALFGPSGAGKSTLAQLIAGLIRPTRGHVRLGAESLADAEAGLFVPPHRRRIGVVFQDSRLFPHLSVRRNLLYGAWFNRADRSRLGAIVDLLGIGHLLDRRPATLSGGEARRVAIGRALLAAPRLLVLDEPLTGLDEARKDEILPYLERLHGATGLPMVYISHALDEVVRLADTLVLLERGRVAAAGPLAAMMPLLGLGGAGTEAGAVIVAQVAVLDAVHGLATLDFAGGRLVVPADGLIVGQGIRIHVRARDVAVAVEPPRGVSILNIVPAVVVALAPAPGIQGAVDVSLAAGGTRLLARITSLSAETLALRPGQAVHAMIKSVSLGRRPEAAG